MRSHLAFASIASLLVCGAAYGADGLIVPRTGAVWPQWQARITVSTATLAPVTLADSAGTRPMVQSGSVLGDWYVDAPELRVPSLVGGLRATGGLMSGARGMALGTTPQAWRSGRFGLVLQNGSSPLASDANAETVPYLGVGYTGWSLKGGWGVSADLGLVAERPGYAGRAVFGNSGWESSLREMRISPVLQLGVSYAF